MGYVSAGTAVFHVWDLATGQVSALTGLSGTMSTTLMRFEDASTSASASETVTIAEIGSTAFYSISYTPVNAELYRGVVEESSLKLVFSFEDDVLPAGGSVATENDSYCSEADVVAYVQMGDYGAATTPTETQVLGFMAKRASDVYGRLRKVMAADAPGPANFSVTIDTSTDAGLALTQAARQANALGAAVDALEAAGAGEGPSRTDRVETLWTVYLAALDELETMARAYVGIASFVSNHVIEGRVTKGTVTSATEQGFTFDGNDRW